ncbi:hypothetical protein ASD65_02665 [Microbacterium sp. Root61]|uniref:ABC transporter substrate-binding protein n=1 Tax=Microbacterium sp. Root61 TaxID=1736570 RepID=UPI000700A368|nr:ABC transporter substrate-binding protein [Microbacterium sp. Root61]KRA23439.1 hypothetical protein ASD65_02665 [Microbacterium sp. Root61]
MKRTGRATAVVIALSTALVFTGCSASTPETGDAESIVTVARAGDVTTLNADAVASSKEGWETLMLVANSLFAFDSEGTIQPRIAEGFEYNADNTVLTVTLRDDVTFSDGTPVTSADVAFTIENAKEGELQGALYQRIVNIETPDDQTIELTFEAPSSAAIFSLASYAVAIIPEDFGGKTEDEFWQEPVAVGPYKVADWEQGVGITLVRNDEYFGEPASIDRIEFLTVPDANTRLLQLQNGTADIIDAVTTAQIDQITQTDGLSVEEFTAGQNYFFTMNTTGEPFSSPEARRAVSLGIDRESVVEAALGGHGVPGASFVVPTAVGGFAPAFGALYDPAAAKKEMAAAGLEGGFSFELMYTSGDPTVETALQVVQQNLAEIGITVTLAGLDNDAIAAKVEANDWDAYVVNIISEADAGEVLQYYGATNGFYAGEQDIMAQIEAYNAQADADFSGQDGRNAIFADALDLIADTAVQVSIMDPARLWGVSDAVSDVQALNTTGALDFTRLTLAK